MRRGQIVSIAVFASRKACVTKFGMAEDFRTHAQGLHTSPAFFLGSGQAMTTSHARHFFESQAFLRSIRWTDPEP